MSEMAEKKRSDSSLAFRAQLKREYVIVPEISMRVSIDRYVQIAKIAQEEARKSLKRLEYSRAYIDLNKFLLLVSKIASHPRYGERNDIKKWAKTETEVAFALLEDTVTALDAFQDQLNEEDINRKLAEAFDLDEDEKKPIEPKTKTNAISTVHHTVVAVEPNEEPSISAANVPNMLHIEESFSRMGDKTVSLPIVSETKTKDIEQDPFLIFTEPSKLASSIPIDSHTDHLPTKLPEPSIAVEMNANEQAEAERRRQKLLTTFFVPEYEGHTLPTMSSSSSVPSPLYPTLPTPTIPSSLPSLMPPVQNSPTIVDNTINKKTGKNNPYYSFLLTFVSSDTHISVDHLCILELLYSNPSNPAFHVPMPASKALDFYLSPSLCFPVIMDDFHASFTSFLQAYPLSVELQASRAAMESNRCFYLHLGVATQVHPFILQCYFRQRAVQLMSISQGNLWYEDLLQSVLQYTGFVDANVLSFLWPREWQHYRICIVSGSERPIFSLFEGPELPLNASNSKEAKKEVLIHCNGAHFTLLRPRQFQFVHPGSGGGAINTVQVNDTGHQHRAFQVIDRLLSDAEAAGLTVQRHKAMNMVELAEMSGMPQNADAFVNNYEIGPHQEGTEDVRTWMPSIALSTEACLKVLS